MQMQFKLPIPVFIAILFAARYLLMGMGFLRLLLKGRSPAGAWAAVRAADVALGREVLAMLQAEDQR